MNVVWISSYPRSGNTWVRRFLAFYFYGRTDENGIYEMIPDIHQMQNGRGLNEEYDGTILAKSHLPLSSQHPYFSHTAGFVYIYRHPKDVLLSCIGYHKSNKTLNIESDRQYVECFIQNMGDSAWENLGFGSWVGNVTSWMDFSSNFPHLFMEYECLISDTERQLARLIKFLAPPHDVNYDKISQFIVSESGFTPRTGQSLDHLGEGLDEAFNTRFREILSKLGYC